MSLTYLSNEKGFTIMYYDDSKLYRFICWESSCLFKYLCGFYGTSDSYSGTTFTLNTCLTINGNIQNCTVRIRSSCVTKMLSILDKLIEDYRNDLTKYLECENIQQRLDVLQAAEYYHPTGDGAKEAKEHFISINP